MSRKPNPAKGIGKDIRDARESLDWSQHRLASEAGVSRPTIARSVRVSVSALMAGTAPGDLHIRVNGTKGTSVLRPIQVSNLRLSSHSGEVVFDLQPRESATVRLTGDSGLFLYSGDWRDQYNEFKAEVTYV